MFLIGALDQTNAAHFTSTVTQPGGQNWNATIWDPGPVAPAAGNTYELLDKGVPFGNAQANTRIRNAAVAGIHRFPGDSLTLNTNTEIRAKTAGAILNFPGVGEQPGLILNGGVLNAGDDTVFQLTGKVLVQATSFIVPGDNGGGAVRQARGFNIAAQLIGSGDLVIWQAGTQVAQEFSGNQNSFTGNWLVKAGWLLGSGQNSLGTGNITIDPFAAIEVDGSVAPAEGPAQLELGYDIASPGKLTLINGGVMILHQNVTFKEVEIEGTVLTEGVHPYDELIANFPSNFAPDGSGSITVKAPSLPSAPLDLAAVNGDTAVNLSWSSSGGATGYIVSRGTATGGPYTPVTLVAGPAFIDTGLANGTIYYYVVAASNVFGVSANSTQVAARPSPPVVGLTTTGGTDGVTLNWTPFAGATSYSVSRSASAGGPYTSIASAITGETYLDGTAESGNRYFYRVVGKLDNGFDTAPSAEVAGFGLPTKPTLSASLYSRIDAPLSAIRVKLTTADPFTPDFLLERSIDGVNFAPLATVTGTNRYVDTAVSLGTVHSYRVRAKNGSGTSEYSDVAEVTFPSSVTFTGVNFANAINGTPADNPAPTPTGYMQDVGEFFGDRGNGFQYGWDRDVTADGRWRMNANSADLRYDTFEHLQKAQPSAIWEITIPNGAYVVHFASGDPTAVDSLFQFDVEGVITSSYQPVTGDWWNEWTGNCTVADGALTVTSGPDATNNKINFIEIYAAPTVSDAPRLSIAANGGDITVTWTNGGTLQSKTDLGAATWTDLGTTGTHTEPIPAGSGAKFFRVTR